MTISNILHSFLLLSTVAIWTLGCGSGRQVQSVVVTPRVADARSSPTGEVQFLATGTFSKPPSPVPLKSSEVTWCAGSTGGKCVGNINAGVTVDQNGLAQCVPGFTGTVTILAGTGGAVANPDGGAQLKTFGAAQLTCP